MLTPLSYLPANPDWSVLLADWLPLDDPRAITAALVVDEAGQVIGVVGSDTFPDNLESEDQALLTGNILRHTVDCIAQPSLTLRNSRHW